MFLFIFIFLSNFSYSQDDSPPIIFNVYSPSFDGLTKYFSSLLFCYGNYFNASESKYYLIFKCIISETKGNEEYLKQLLQFIYGFDFAYKEIVEPFLIKLNDEKITKIFEFLREDINNGSFVIDGIFSLLNQTDYDGKYLLNYVYINN